MAERALTDAAWYLLLFWLLLYLQKGRGFTPQMVARIGWIPYAAADGGALFGGWLASRLIQRGVPLLKARTGAMFGFALLMPASLAAFYIPPDQPMLAVALFSVAAFGHMAWGANSLTLHSDLFPPASVATIMGISGAAGSLGGVAAGAIVGPLVDQVGSYLPVFVATTVLHPVSAVLVVVALWPRRAYNRS
jgi:ACS family hexuronate transporter-like MFS transporter